MQLSSLIIAVGVATVAADVSLPPCGSWCTSNITNSASEFGCQSSTDFHCLCSNVTFGYAVHDCAHQYCQNDTAADVAVAWAISACSSATVPIVLPPASVPVIPDTTGVGEGAVTSTVISTIVTGGSTITTSYITTAAAGAGPTGSASATETSGSDSGSGPSTATATSTFTFVITSGGSTITSTGVTTLFGTGGSNGSPSGTETTTVSGTASPTESASATDTSGSAETVSSSATSASSTAGGSIPTNAPGAALYLAAGIAAVLL